MHLKDQFILEMGGFSYLCSKITNDGISCKDILSRINQGKCSVNKKINNLLLFISL